MCIWKWGWSSLFFKDLFYPFYVQVRDVCWGCLQNLEKGAGSPKAKVVGHCEPPSRGAGTWAQILLAAEPLLQHWSSMFLRWRWWRWSHGQHLMDGGSALPGPSLAPAPVFPGLQNLITVQTDSCRGAQAPLSRTQHLLFSSFPLKNVF